VSVDVVPSRSSQEIILFFDQCVLRCAPSEEGSGVMPCGVNALRGTWSAVARRIREDQRRATVATRDCDADRC